MNWLLNYLQFITVFIRLMCNKIALQDAKSSIMWVIVQHFNLFPYE